MTTDTKPKYGVDGRVGTAVIRDGRLASFTHYFAAHPDGEYPLFLEPTAEHVSATPAYHGPVAVCTLISSGLEVYQSRISLGADESSRIHESATKLTLASDGGGDETQRAEIAVYSSPVEVGVAMSVLSLHGDLWREFDGDLPEDERVDIWLRLLTGDIADFDGFSAAVALAMLIPQ